MDPILLLTDFSPVSLNASQYALHLAQTPGQHITLLHALNKDENETRQSCEQQLELFKAKLEDSAKANTRTIPTIKYVSKKGSLTESLKQLLKEQPIGLVVMGASDGKALPGYLFGKMVRDIIEVANKPLLLIPEQVTFAGIKKLFYVTDLRYLNSNTFTWLIQMTSPLHLAISLLHVTASGLPNLSPSEASSLFGDTVTSMTKHPVQLFNTTKEAEAEEVVKQMVENKQLSILAVTHHKYHFFKRIFSEAPSTLSGVFKQIPLLILPV
ncbi:Nucleotide-binding universal stress protein, UspA family [bacterium A37T11]|nr:Nucleotide-binding universal stress protein, UspA family [bacterium A37T11]